MGMYIFLDKDMETRFSKITDKELNDLLQEARTVDESILIEERAYYVLTGLPFFRKKVIKVRYTVYHKSNAADGSLYQARVLTCCKNYETIYSYLCGIINGHHAKQILELTT